MGVVWLLRYLRFAFVLMVDGGGTHVAHRLQQQHSQRRPLVPLVLVVGIDS